MASQKGLQEFSKHCYVSLESTKRRLEYSDFGGKAPALEAADYFLTQGKKLMLGFDVLGRRPVERKQWIKDNFGDESSIPQYKSLAAQKEILLSQLVGRQVPWFEASMMQVAVRAMPGIENKEALSLTYDDDLAKFKAVLSADNENVIKMFDKLSDARNWLLNMGKSSEARWLGCKTQSCLNSILYEYVVLVRGIQQIEYFKQHISTVKCCTSFSERCSVCTYICIYVYIYIDSDLRSNNMFTNHLDTRIYIYIHYLPCRLVF